MTPLRVAHVGLDHYHATGWAETLALFPEIEVVALYDPDRAIHQTLRPSFHDPNLPAAFPERYRALPLFTDLDALLADERIELALVTLPSDVAPAAIARLAAAGIHLLADKPAARTAAEARVAIDVAKAAGVKLAVAFTRRYGQGWRDARLMVERGRLGRLLTAEAIFTSSSVRVRDPRNPLFRHDRAGGGVLHWIGIHDVDLLLWLLGERIVEVQAMAANVGGEEIDVEDGISVALRIAGGALGTIHYAYALPRPCSDGYVALRGSDGSLKIAPDGALTWIGRGDNRDPTTIQRATYETAPSPGYGPGGRAIVADLLQAIREDREPVATGDDLVRALTVIDAIYEAARSGRRVQVDSDG